jgi:hypothetical protein
VALVVVMGVVAVGVSEARYGRLPWNASPLAASTSKCGAWRIVASPNIVAADNTLQGVAVISRTDAWAVGSSYSGKPLFEHWDGTTWSIVPGPNVYGGLSAVAAASATDIWAVGAYSAIWYNSAYRRTLIEHYDGTSWAVVPSPNVPGVDNALQAVAVAGGTAWAVGSTTHGEASSSPQIPSQATLIERWDGARWSIVPSPNGPIVDHTHAQDDLSSVTIAADGDAWAVGYMYTGKDTSGATLIEHWDGTRWTVMAYSMGEAALHAVTAVSARDVWAAGGHHGNPLLLHWDGSRWNEVTSPGFAPGTSNSLYAITSDPAVRAVVAVGVQTDSDQMQRTLAEAWSGTTAAWNTLDTPDPANVYMDSLNAVSADAAGDVFAVGTSNVSRGGAGATLIEAYVPVPC